MLKVFGVQVKRTFFKQYVDVTSLRSQFMCQLLVFHGLFPDNCCILTLIKLPSQVDYIVGTSSWPPHILNAITRMPTRMRDIFEMTARCRFLRLGSLQSPSWGLQSDRWTLIKQNSWQMIYCRLRVH